MQSHTDEHANVQTQRAYAMLAQLPITMVTHMHKHTRTRQNIDKEGHTQLSIVHRFTQALVGPLHGSSSTQADPGDTCFLLFF